MFEFTNRRGNLSALCTALYLATFLTACNAEPGADKRAAVAAPAAKVEAAAIYTDADFKGTISGESLDFSGLEEVETEQVKSFRKTGVNPYVGDASILKEAEQDYLARCSGCHGHIGEGKLGPALNDNYWTYPANETDKGLFETIYGGANGMMGPQKGLTPQDEILKIIAWIRNFKNIVPH
ncbi:MAG: cytochrome c(L), periplasmic [Methylophilaceae bacterium]|nr:cytochrome c(L), periplasmic [Methylophilaceae bacterium]